MQVMQRIYFDNAATTPLDKEVLEAMLPYMTTHFGNPSSIYSYGRETKLAVENSRKLIAKILGAKPGEIFFTSGGTESNNTAITAAIRDLGCTHIITSAIEHHAVLHTIEHYTEQSSVDVSYVAVLPNGQIDYEDLEKQLAYQSALGHKCLVSLMHANNEIGTLLSIKYTGELCKKYKAIFHSDCVQTIGHYPINLNELYVHFISVTAHKFHGPKGTGILYVNDNIQIKPLIFGGGQERNIRAGTENVYGIVGFAKALEIATRDYEKDSAYIRGLRTYMITALQKAVPDVSFNGDLENGLYTVLSVCFPRSEKTDFLLMNLDINNICVSGGSACSSGVDIGSHVMQVLHKDDTYTTLRFSFSKYNTKEEIDKTIEVIKKFI
jgi:cysteine desulfurase